MNKWIAVVAAIALTALGGVLLSRKVPESSPVAQATPTVPVQANPAHIAQPATLQPATPKPAQLLPSAVPTPLPGQVIIEVAGQPTRIIQAPAPVPKDSIQEARFAALEARLDRMQHLEAEVERLKGVEARFNAQETARSAGDEALCESGEGPSGGCGRGPDSEDTLETLIPGDDDAWALKDPQYARYIKALKVLQAETVGDPEEERLAKAAALKQKIITDRLE